MADPPNRPSDRTPRPEDRPVDPDAIRRLERIPGPATGGGATSGSSLVRGPISARAGRGPLVTTAGGILIAVGLFVAVVSVLVVLPSDGMRLLGTELSGGAAGAMFLVLAGMYVLTGVLVLLRRPSGRPLGFVVGSLALVIGFAQLPSAGINGVPTIGVAAFVLFALGVGGNEFRRG